jgi:hypothetical protein
MFLYLTGNRIGVLATLHRDFAPVCQPKSADVPFQTSVAVALECSDPNNDALTLSITAQPTAGNLGAIDQSAKTVRYNPFSAFSGPDSFQYAAAGAGVTSAAATVSLTVASAPTPTPSTGGNGTGNPAPQGGVAKIASHVSAVWHAAAKFTTVKQLTVTGIPAGATVTVRCSGKGCPFSSKSRASSGGGTTKLVGLFNFTTRAKKGKRARRVVSKLAVKDHVEIQVTAPGKIGRDVLFVIRARKNPVVGASCLAPTTNAKVTC